MTSIAAEIQTRIAAIEYPTIEQFPDADERRVAQHEHRAAVKLVEEDFARELADYYLDDISPARRQAVGEFVYAQAWGDGHSSGYSGVENAYIDLAEMALGIYKLATS